jgi:hypothetical protein
MKWLSKLVSAFAFLAVLAHVASAQEAADYIFINAKV